jgi:hypothetical protein
MVLTLTERVSRDAITIHSGRLASAPENASPEEARHPWYLITLTLAGRTIQTDYMTGLSDTAKPGAAEVTDALVSLARDIQGSHDSFSEWATFEEWADTLGYNPDSRAAEAIYEAQKIIAAEVRDFLGDAYQEYLWETVNDL